MRLLDALRNSVIRLEAGLADSRLFDHMGDRGEFREQVVERFLRPYLPKCYGLGSGAIFSANGMSSRQIDIVLYDAVFSNVLFSDSPNSLYPAESVFGAIEVKSDLDFPTKNGRAVKDVRNIRTPPGRRTPAMSVDGYGCRTLR